MYLKPLILTLFHQIWQKKVGFFAKKKLVVKSATILKNCTVS